VKCGVPAEFIVVGIAYVSADEGGATSEDGGVGERVELLDH
jgi:hypothetical protein